MSPTKLVEEEHRTETAPPAPVVNAEPHSNHAHNSSDFIDSIIKEATNSGNNPPPRFVKEVKEEFSIPEVNIRGSGHKNTSTEASGENTILLGAFDIADIATEQLELTSYTITIIGLFRVTGTSHVLLVGHRSVKFYVAYLALIQFVFFLVLVLDSWKQ